MWKLKGRSGGSESRGGIGVNGETGHCGEKKGGGRRVWVWVWVRAWARKGVE